MREFSPLAIILGVLIGILFGAANAYIGLKVGMTVSASIPAAVISMAVLRGLLKRGTILENNMVQTVGSVGESLAAGMIFTIPALFVFAYVDHKPEMAPTFWEMTVWGSIGGLLGVFFMIPLRRMLIVKEHGKLPFPEGTACAEVLQAGQAGGVSAKTVFWGLGVGALYEFFRGLGFWAESARQRLPLLKTEVSLAAEPALLGVGYILGVRVAGYILGGAVLGWFVIIPLIAFFGADAAAPIFPEAKSVISQMSPGDMWNRYLRYIGAGAVVLGGLFSLFKSLGTIGGSIFSMFSGGGSGERTDRDIPTIVLLLAIIGIGVGMYYLPQLTYTQTDEAGVKHVQHFLNPVFQNITIIACVITFGFFFTTVSARLVGIVGSSSNPASGMTIATLLGTALIVVNTMDLDPTTAKVAIISIGALVCMCICLAGDTSQDLKTGYLVHATPWKQQAGQVIGVLTATAALSGVLWLINDRLGYSNEYGDHPNAVLAPQANLMKLLVQGVVDQQLPWALIFAGAGAALVVELFGLPSLPFAVGLYLPLSLSTPIMVGGAIRWLIERRRKGGSDTHGPGVLAASGLVAGHGLMGVMFIGVAALIGWGWNNPRFTPPDATDPQLVIVHHFKDWASYKVGFDYEYGLGTHETGAFTGDYAVKWFDLLPLLPFAAMAIWLLIIASRRTDGETGPGVAASAAPGGGSGPPAGVGSGVTDPRAPPPQPIDSGSGPDVAPPFNEPRPPSDEPPPPSDEPPSKPFFADLEELDDKPKDMDEA